jgi:hypothetical protein
MVDEGAAPLTTNFSLVQGHATSVAAPWGEDELLVTTLATGFVPAFVVTPDMRVRGPIELARLVDEGSSILTVQITAGANDRYLVSYSTDTGAVVVSVIERLDSTDIAVVENARVLLAGADRPSALASVALGDRFALLYETGPFGTRERHVRFLDEATPIYSAPADGGTAIDLVSDGTNLVFREGDEIVFVSPAGTVIGRHVEPPPSSGARSSIASGDGFVYALASGGMMFSRVSAAGGVAVPSPTSLASTTNARIFRTGPYVLATNTTFEVEVVILDATTGSSVERFGFSTFTGTPPGSLSAVPAFGGGAIVAGSDPGLGTGAVIALARACGS